MSGAGDGECRHCMTRVVFALETGRDGQPYTRAFDAQPHAEGTHLINGPAGARVARWLHPRERGHAAERHRPHAPLCTGRNRPR